MQLAPSISWISTGLALGLAAGCSVILDFPQCVDDVDCSNAVGVDLVCVDNECVARIDPSTVACSTDADCLDAFDESVVCGIAGACAPLTTARCELKIRPSDASPDEIVYIGSVLPLTGTYDELGVRLEHAVQLAVEDFNSTTTLPKGAKVAWVSCDSKGSATEAGVAASELTDAGIVAVVGPALSQEMIEVANVTARSGAFLISPSASASAFAQLVDEGLVWRTIGNDATQAAGIADRIASFDPPAERVVALVKNDRYGQGLIDDLAPRLGAILPTDGLGTLLYSDLDKFPDTQAMRSEYGARVAAVFERNPDVIVVLGSVEARELVLFYLEAWASTEPRPVLPRFVLSSEAAPWAESIVEGVTEGFRSTLMSRMEAVAHETQDPDNYGPFEIRYEIRFTDREADLEAGLAYDATMTTLLAMSALSSGTPTGAQIAGAVARLSDEGGMPVSFGDGLSFITATQQLLDAGADVALRGTSGLLDFELQTGDLRRNLTGFDLEPVPGTSTPRLTARRRYEVGPAPAVAGTWVDL